MRIIAKFALAIALLCFTVPTLVAKNDTQSYNYSRALDEINNDNPKTALEYLYKEIEENPKNGYAYMLIASIHQDNAEYGYARTAVESALKFLPRKDKESLSHVHFLKGELLAIECDTVGAYSELEIAARLDPTNEDIFEYRGQLLYEQGRYDDSDKDYQKLYELNPGGVMGSMGLGRNCYARNEYDKAIEHYSRIIAMFPDYPSGFSYRAEANLAKGEYLKAIDDICAAFESNGDNKAYRLLFMFPPEQLPLVTAKLKGLSAKNPYSGEYEYYLGILYRERRMFKESNEAFERSNSIDARSFIFEDIAENYSEIGDYLNALSYIDRAIQMDPENTDLIAKRADILGESGDIDGAISGWSKYIDKNPDFYGGYYRRGFFEDNSDRTEEALADYEMAVMLNPTYFYGYLGKGDMLEKLGRHDDALEAYRMVVELDTVPCNSSCAMYALLALGRPEEAISFMDKVIANDSIYPGNYYDGACFYCGLGNMNKAYEYLQTALDKGYVRLQHIRMDDDLEELRKLPEFEELMKQYESRIVLVEPTDPDEKLSSHSERNEPVEIPFTPAGGVMEVECKVNNLPLKFIFDTGASSVSLSMVEANFMLKNGYLRRSDIVGSGSFIDANGDISEGTLINLREIDFGGLKLDNVHASVVRNQKAPLLLGQSVLGRLGKIEIDYQNKKIIIKPN